jgi:hypothetical protein
VRRSPKEILAAHRMDPTRRELYVEGRTDRIFLDYLVGPDKSVDARIIEIGLVELGRSAIGGEKGRLIDFAREVEGAGAQIKIFADADTDRILERSIPANVWLTDKRDLEGYILRKECVEKILRLGFLDERLDADEVLRQVTSLGRQLGVLRLMSDIDKRALPFQDTAVRGHITVERTQVEFNLAGYVQALLQNGDISLKQLPEVIERQQEVASQYSHVDDAQIVHGKDALTILERFLRANGLQSEDIGRLLRTSYERQGQVLKFL